MLPDGAVRFMQALLRPRPQVLYALDSTPQNHSLNEDLLNLGASPSLAQTRLTYLRDQPTMGASLENLLLRMALALDAEAQLSTIIFEIRLEIANRPSDLGRCRARCVFMSSDFTHVTEYRLCCLLEYCTCHDQRWEYGREHYQR